MSDIHYRIIYLQNMSNVDTIRKSLEEEVIYKGYLENILKNEASCLVCLLLSLVLFVILIQEIILIWYLLI